jgi:hypothetical protein
MKLDLFLTSRLNNWLHKCLPPWVDAIGKKVAIVVLVVICFKLHQWTLQALSFVVTLEEH